jgi:type II secretory pathway component PulM
MWKRWRQLSADTKWLLLIAVLLTVYVVLWTLYFLGFFAAAHKR